MVSCRKVLARVFELHDEVQSFLTLQEHECTQVIGDDQWVPKLTYLSDIFVYLNEQNRQMRARMKTLPTPWTKLKVFEEVEVVARTYC
jgi:hypothetical protein